MKRFKILFSGILLIVTAAFFISSCSNNSKKSKQTKKEKTKMSITRENFGKTKQAKQVYLYTLKNENGITVKITNYGGIVTSLTVPDNQGKFDDIVLGFDSLKSYTSEKYINACPYFGALIGRYANRIAKGRFILYGKEYKLACNNGVNHLHGGIKGFDKVVWDAQEIKNDSIVGLKLSYHSKDKEEGYPGNLLINVIYSLNNKNEIKIDYKATTDKATPVNFTHHSYFNLAGAGSSNILNHIMMINADKYTVVDNSLIPTGELRDVKGTPMDFTSPKTIGSEIAKVKGGYDNNYVLNKDSVKLSFAARVYEPSTGRVMEVYTTQPGIQFYSGNFLDGTITGKKGRIYKKHYGFCLETQHFPDSPNQPDFPSTILRPGEKYHQITIYKFSVR